MKKIIALSYFVMLIAGGVFAEDFSAYDNYVYDPNDFATDWIEYQPNGMGRDWLNGEPFDNPENVLGRPTFDTTGDDWFFPEDDYTPVNPIYPAFRYNELLFLGDDGYVVVEFNHPVRDDENNPYGIDLLVFGNAFQVLVNGGGWENGNPESYTVLPEGYHEDGVVSVSQDGITWYSFARDTDFMTDDPDFIKLTSDPNDPEYDPNDGPFCDSFAPTLGRVYSYDPIYADPNLITDPNTGRLNQWWAEPTNPTLPVDPDLGFSSFGGYTLARICNVYGSSAGGTGYDIGKLNLPVDPDTGLKWIKYVRVDDKFSGGNAEIDAFADVSACGDYKHPFPMADFTQDCIVNLYDFAFFAGYWLDDFSDPESHAYIVDLEVDDTIDLSDLLLVAEEWLDCTWDCD